MGITVGIDLGTTNSVVARLNEDGEPVILKNSEGKQKTRSVVQLRENETVVGEAALRAALRFPDTTVRQIKRYMGDEKWEIEAYGETYTPEQISALILEKLIKDAEEEIGGEEIDEAVITVPAYFGAKEREATKNAAEIAGIEVKRLLNEPTAACLRYGLEDDEETVLVYDLGGGTFDATVVNLSQKDGVTVDGVKGGQQLGGDDFDRALYEEVMYEEFVDQVDQDPAKDDELEWQLLETAKEVKEDLSVAESAWATMNLGTESYEQEITREEFNEATEHLVDETLDIIDDLFDSDNVGSKKDDVDRVLLVGGSTRIPIVQQRVEDYFDVEPSKELDQDMVVAEGAAMATDLEQLEMKLDGDFQGEGSSVFTDVVSKTIGIEAVDLQSEDGDTRFVPVLEENTEVPATSEREDFTTVEDGQTSLEIRILEGGDPDPEKNERLGRFMLEGIPRQPAGEPEFRITFRVDEDGVLHAEAENIETGEQADTTLDIGLSQTGIAVAREQHEEIPDVR